MSTFCFDFVNTLAFSHEPTSTRIFSMLSREFNSDISLIEIERNLRILDEVFHFSSVSMKTEKSKKEFYIMKNTQLLKTLGIHNEHIAQKIYLELIEKRGVWRLFPETKSTLQELSQKGHTLVLASNFDTNLKSILSELDIIHHFKILQISAEVEVEKPDELFFSLLKSKVGADPQEIFFIGDNRKLDYEPALKFGFIPILLDPYGIHPTINRRIEKLDELLDLM